MTNKMSNKTQKSASEFVSKLVKELESGNVAIFSGAGISIPSGLPSSLNLIKNILNKVHISDKTPDDILSVIPFERFFELLLESSLSKKIIDLFEIGKPNVNHYLIARFINCLGNLGNNYLNQKKYSEAITTFEKALEISKETNNKYGMSIQLENLGNAYSDVGYQYFIRAMNNHHEALKIIDETGQEAHKYPHLANLGSAYLRLGDFSTALKYNEEALKVVINSRDKPREAEIRTNIGSVFLYYGL